MWVSYPSACTVRPRCRSFLSKIQTETKSLVALKLIDELRIGCLRPLRDTIRSSI